MIILNNYIISEAFDSLRHQKLNESTSRQELMDLVDSIYEKCNYLGLQDEAEEIFRRNHASEDDGDPNEGFYKTMSNQDLENAYKELMNLLPRISEDELITAILDAVRNIDSDAIIVSNRTDNGFNVVTPLVTYQFNLEPVELDDNSISYTEDDFGDWK